MLLWSEEAASDEVQCQQCTIRKPRPGCKVPNTVCSCSGSIPTEAHFTTGIISPTKQPPSFLHLASHLNTKPLDGSEALACAKCALFHWHGARYLPEACASETTRMVDWALALHFGSLAKPLVQSLEGVPQDANAMYLSILPARGTSSSSVTWS